MLSISIIAIIMSCLTIFQKVERIFCLISGILVFCAWLIVAPFYFEIKENKIVVFQGIMSSNKELRSSYKRKEYLFEEMNDIYVNNKEHIFIRLKDGNVIRFSIMGCLRKNEILDVIQKIRAKINN